MRESGCINFLPEKYLPKIRGGKNFIFCWTGNFIEKQRILNLKLTGQKPIYKLESNLGLILLITSNHKILTNKGWKKIDQLVKNNFIGAKLLIGFKSLANFGKSSITWEKINKIKYFQLAPVYDLHISKIIRFRHRQFL